MATNHESASTNKQSPGKPPMTSSQLLRTPPPGAVDSSLGERVDSLKLAVESILKDTKWPSESEHAATELLNTIKSSPNIPSNATNDSQDLIKKYILILEDVEAQLKDAKSKSGMKRWKLLEGMRSIASNRPSKCTLLFQTCQDDVSKVVTSINELLDNEREKEEDLAASRISPEAQARRTVPNAGRGPTPLSATPPKPSEQNIASNHSTSGASSTQIPLPLGSEDEGFRGPVRQEALTIARKTFKAAEIVSGSIPVAGNFVAAAAKVGLAFVETIQTMDKNDDLAKDLASQTDKLSKCLANFTKTPGTNQGQEIANHVDGLQKELQRVQAKVEGWNSLGRFNKAFHARDHGDVLKGHQGTIQTTMEEMQLLVGLDTRSIVIELKNDEFQEKQRRLLKCLGDGRYGAQGNSVQDVTCFPGTRVQILERIDDWIRDLSAPDRVLWLRGMAGRGKSTIASTVVESWKRRASCAIFHFRRGQNAVNTRVVCALARQLASSLVPEVRNAVLDSVRENEDIADERLEEQFTTLFVASLARLQNQPHPILIVVDALDECDSPKDAIAFIRLIHEHSASFPANVKFLLTTRPEAQLLRALEPRKWRSDDLDTAPDVSSDLERFIQQACKQIRDNDPDVPHTWPSSEDVNRLVEMSQGLFQWARTVITYVSDGSPVDRLRDLLGRPSMWSGLDELYHQILSKAFDTIRLDAERENLLHRVLGTLALAPYPVSLEVIAGLYGDNMIFHGAAQADTILFLRKDILADLNSLLFIPRSSAEPIRLMHTSIHDLLISERRCKQASYYINVIQHHQQLASTCLDTMIRDLKENICNLSDLSKSVSEIQDTAWHKVPTALLYCCRSWSIHLTEGVHWPIQGTNTFSVQLAEFEVFSKEKVMFWLEVMSLAGATKDAIIVGKTVYQWLRHRSNDVHESDSLATLWDDVQRFITAFSDPIQFGPLHIYTSALPHCPVETELWKLYRKLAKVQTIKGIPTSTWSSDIWVRSIGKPVGTVAFSPDGNVLASGSDDYTIRLWDTQTGTVVGEPFTGHSNTVRSVCFSPDGKVLASGSEDNTIRLWDTQTGTVIGEPLIGHSSTVRSVCFSPDGKVLASGSDDKTIQLWDTQTGTAIGEPFAGHSHRVWSVCFSPDGNVLASGSEDNTIRLWDIESGTVIGEPLTGHSNTVNSVCFSPDGKVLASGSDDRTIRRWDAQTGTVICEPLTGHNGWVWSVCFSPDGMVLASGSKDETIRLWDTQTGTVIGVPFTGHSGDIHSVCFSPDGQSLASGSNDQTIRLWDTQTRMALCEPPTGHDAWVWSICLSPNGKVLASGDNSIRLWDTQTGTIIGEPLTGHSGDINSVCFSPDGTVLASGSDDRTIRLWDTQTGTVIGEPLTGHSDWVRSVCFSPDGKVLASGSNDDTVRLWDPQTGMALGEPLTAHRNTVYSVSFSQDGSLLSANYIDRVRVTWDVKTRQRCETPHSLPLHHQNPDFQDHWVVVSSSRLIWLPPQYWVNPTPEIFLSGNTLAVLHNGNFSLFDISRALEL